MTKHTCKNVLEYRILDSRIELVKETIFESISQRKPLFLVTVNPEKLHYASKHPSYSELLRKADLLLPDGIGVILASRILRNPIKYRVTGVDLVSEILSDGRSLSVYFLGATDEVVRMLARKVRQQYPHITILGYHHGYFDESQQEHILSAIKSLKPDLLLVGMGYPRQDFIAFEAVSRDCTLVALGVGGTFDVLSGLKTRAPLILRKFGLEWLWRILLEPTRIKRARALPAFLFKVIVLRISARNSSCR
jgi:N-acetylglucosaminyldiphosphoundecaprenol N-acetyl-beta-D-mannosaminyltransferase